MTKSKTFDCAIIGGGFTGLAAAAELARAGHSVIILEKETELGGLAAGFDVGGYELERFYHHWFTSDTHVNALAKQVGVEDQIILRESNTGMYYAGKRFRLSTPGDLLRFGAIPVHDRIRTGFATLFVRRIKNWHALEDLTAKEWLTRLFGKNVFEVIWEPLLIGKFGKYADEISAVWFWNKLALRGSSRGAGGSEQLAYFRGGFAKLAREVAAYIQRHGGTVAAGVDVARIKRDAQGVVLETADGPVSAKTALLTVPLPIAGQLLKDETPVSYQEKLNKIKYLGNVCLILEMTRSLSGLYWTNVNDASFPFVGIIEHTNFEPTESYGGRHIIYLSKYLPVDDPLYSMSADEAFEFALPHLQRMFPDFDEKWVTQRHVWTAEYAQPIVVRHYSSLTPAFETPMPHTYLASMAQVYPEDRGTNYAIREGRRAAVEIRRQLEVAHTDAA
ncbi:NAD(P)/FAD-dependent oxidoreductase [Ruegeria meonggei]|uniref:Pseudooxynicotine oxidase n=1 Tax=Ruegeria meonggei TaxID=1446476 RepID=A0A1X7AC38_9RHOB|nr:NAD(P)/FAD-dependent oxidoreductase [Ruegeria meonggei]SLN75823.1 Pseudooxynicotine oxidase [Ruegeria meonggei]